MVRRSRGPFARSCSAFDDRIPRAPRYLSLAVLPSQRSDLLYVGLIDDTAATGVHVRRVQAVLQVQRHLHGGVERLGVELLVDDAQDLARADGLGDARIV